MAHLLEPFVQLASAPWGGVGGGDREAGRKERKRDGISPEVEWTPGKASLGRTTDPQFLWGQPLGLLIGLDVSLQTFPVCR